MRYSLGDAYFADEDFVHHLPRAEADVAGDGRQRLVAPVQQRRESLQCLLRVVSVTGSNAQTIYGQAISVFP
ncbi:MAG: hypothetical protein MK171_08400 [Pirellulales bacterium]|nr:hypothetical protein [Pirellulales bacterium]